MKLAAYAIAFPGVNEELTQSERRLRRRVPWQLSNWIAIRDRRWFDFVDS
jgi:hypothetical protein